MRLEKYNKLVNLLFEKIPFHGIMDFKDKNENAFSYILYMLNRTQSLFKYEGLPDTIPARMLEIYLQVNGHCCFTEYNGDFYVFTGGLGGEPDPYYMPTIYTVANPALNYSANLKINDECVVINNDGMYIGLMPLFQRYASLLAENELTMSIAIINARIIDLIAAGDDQTKESAEKFLQDVADGKLGVIASNAFLDGLKTMPYTSAGHSNQITQLIELEQYAKAAWLNDLGLNANYNMKREALSTAESQLNDDALRPLIDNMLECRQAALEKINEKYNLNISVDLNSAWKENMTEIELSLESMRADVEALKAGAEADPETDPESDPEDNEPEDNEPEDNEPEADPEDDPEADPEADPEDDPEADPETDPEDDPEEKEEKDDD